jgi:hypothetical protein
MAVWATERLRHAAAESWKTLDSTFRSFRLKGKEMSFIDLGIKFDALGIGTALKLHRLRVPANQRPYAWTDDHVSVLFEDLAAAFSRQRSAYFLGTIVLTLGNEAAQASNARLEVADGQQRLATTSILIAAIRDYLYSKDQAGKATAEKYTTEFLLEYDEFANDSVPKLQLNAEDSQFFLRAILSRPDSPDRASAIAMPKGSSNVRLQAAALAAKSHVVKIVAPYSEKEGRLRLLEWMKFLEENVAVIVIRTTGQIDAYKMFETLNDRGLKASQIDILKNFLFFQAANRTDEVQPRWLSMVSKIESYDDDLLLDYVRHFWISRNGPTKAPELAARFSSAIEGERQALETVIELDETASNYIALLTSLQSPSLSGYSQEARLDLYTVAMVLGIEQIRPLMLAVLRSFSIEEGKAAFRMFVSWSVRFLVAGGGGGGVLDRHYGRRAQEITGGNIQTAKQLSERMREFVPSDTDFRVAFERHRVTKSSLARYYLRSLERLKTNQLPPHLAEYEAPETQANLEHIMPESAARTWGLPQEQVEAFYKRLGNMCLLSPRQNVGLGNVLFSERRGIYTESPYLLTQEIGSYHTWGSEEIETRQKALAELAPRVWPI